jgi:hypothetical protein
MSGITLRPSTNTVVGNPTGAAQPLQADGADAGFFRGEPVYYGALPLEPDAAMRMTPTRATQRLLFECGSTCTRPLRTGERRLWLLRWTNIEAADLAILRAFEQAVGRYRSFDLSPNDPDDGITVTAIFTEPLRVTHNDRSAYSVEAQAIEVFPLE